MGIVDSWSDVKPIGEPLDDWARAGLQIGDIVMSEALAGGFHLYLVGPSGRLCGHGRGVIWAAAEYDREMGKWRRLPPSVIAIHLDDLPTIFKVYRTNSIHQPLPEIGPDDAPPLSHLAAERNLKMWFPCDEGAP